MTYKEFKTKRYEFLRSNPIGSIIKSVKMNTRNSKEIRLNAVLTEYPNDEETQYELLSLDINESHFFFDSLIVIDDSLNDGELIFERELTLLEKHQRGLLSTNNMRIS